MEIFVPYAHLKTRAGSGNSPKYSPRRAPYKNLIFNHCEDWHGSAVSSGH